MSDDLAARQAINAAITDGGDLLKDLQDAHRTLRQESLLDRLDGMLANLQQHIDERAHDLARPLIAQAHAEAFDEVKSAQDRQQRAEDLVAELRRQIRVLERQRDELQAAIARVRRLCDLTIAASCRAQAIDQARDTLAALDGQESDHA